jgi:hypothetical protein
MYEVYIHQNLPFNTLWRGGLAKLIVCPPMELKVGGSNKVNMVTITTKNNSFKIPENTLKAIHETGVNQPCVFT